MGYSNSLETLEKMLPHLEKLKTGDPTAWETSPGGADLLAYKIREALHIARRYRKQYPELAQAAEIYRIRKLSGQVVQAEPTKQLVAETTQVRLNEKDAETFEDLREVGGPQTPTTIIEAWIDRGRPKLYFRDAALDDDQLRQLFKWSEARGLLLMPDPSGVGITVMKEDLDPSLKEFALREEDLL